MPIIFVGTDETQVIDEIPLEQHLEIRPPYLPLAIPRDLSDRMIRLHGDPRVWWVSQFIKYILRYQPETQKMINDAERKMNFTKPVVGYVYLPIYSTPSSCPNYPKRCLFLSAFTSDELIKLEPKQIIIPLTNTWFTSLNFSIESR